MATYTEDQLYELTNQALKEVCKDLEISGTWMMTKSELVSSILKAQGPAKPEKKEAAAPVAEGDVDPGLVDFLVDKVQNSSAKKVQFDLSHSPTQAAVLARLTPEERKKVCFGVYSGSITSIKGYKPQ